MYKTCRIRIGISKQQTMFKEHSDYCESEQLAKEIESICNEYENNGFQVVSIFPITKGIYNCSTSMGYGYSVTDSVIITFRK